MKTSSKIERNGNHRPQTCLEMLTEAINALERAQRLLRWAMFLFAVLTLNFLLIMWKVWK